MGKAKGPAPHLPFNQPLCALLPASRERTQRVRAQPSLTPTSRVPPAAAPPPPGLAEGAERARALALSLEEEEGAEACVAASDRPSGTSAGTLPLSAWKSERVSAHATSERGRIGSGSAREGEDEEKQERVEEVVSWSRCCRPSGGALDRRRGASSRPDTSHLPCSR